MGVFRIVLLIGLTLVVDTIDRAEAAVALLPNATHPDYPGACYDSHRELSVKPNEEVQLKGECAVMHCAPDFTLSFYSCGLAVIDSPDCVKTGQDLTKNYPECCKKYTCTAKDGSVIYV